MNYARRLRINPVVGSTGQHIFMTYGVGDTFSPPETMRAFAQSAGLAHVRPVIESISLSEADAPLSGNATIGGEIRTHGLRQYMPTGGDDGHFVSTRTTQGRADVIRFALETLAGQTPNIGEP